MWGLSGSSQPELSSLIPKHQQQKIPALPLQFEYLPVEILSKEFTKLNSNHPYRIHYLGPRPLNTLLLHKRYAQKSQGAIQQKCQKELYKVIQFDSYKINLRKIINCNFMNEKMQSNSHYKSSLFYRAFEGMNPYLSLPKEFIFNSAFQSGNLDCAIKVKSNEFDLFLRIDSNTRGHTSWYYFSVKNGKKKQKIVINICNLTKPSVLYDQGMKPFVFSKRLWVQNGISWQQDPINECKLEEAQLRYEIIYQTINLSQTYKLSFQYEFMSEDDEVFFAYCIPYTYSQLQYDIQQYEQSTFVKKSILGKTLTGLDLPILHITNHQSNEIKKKNIVITARVHPGQSNSSLILNGFISYLIESSKDAQELRNKCNFFIIPMLNPDGVVLGNTRSGAAGKDLNREFLSSKKDLYPQIYSIKSLTAKLQKIYGVSMYIDFHGHSRKKNTFLYGPNYPLSHSQYYKCRGFPKIVEKIDSKFRFYSCSFAISQQKRSTARAVMLNQLKIPYSYTIESSIGLYYNPQTMKTAYFNESSWLEMGINIGSGLSTFMTSLIDFDLYLIQRRIQRNKMKQIKALQVKSSKLKEDDAEPQIKAKRNLLFDIFQEIKVISSQMKQPEQQLQSDDHDQDQDLQNFKLKQFNNLVINGRQRQKKVKQVSYEDEQQEFNIVAPTIIPQDYQELFKDKVQQQPKRPFSLIKNTKSSDTKRVKIFNLDQIIKKNEIVIKKQRYSQQIQEQKIKKTYKMKREEQTLKKEREQQKWRKESKNFVLSNKQRYSVTSKFTYPIQDRCQILTLPKNIQIMRKQMKKGRGLISNIEQSRSKIFYNKTLQPKIVSKEQKASLLHSDLIKLRLQSRLSTGSISSLSGQTKNQIFSSARKSQHHIIESTYMALNGLELDNMAMTITTFRPYK